MAMGQGAERTELCGTAPNSARWECEARLTAPHQRYRRERARSSTGSRERVHADIFSIMASPVARASMGLIRSAACPDPLSRHTSCDDS
jgi:hypothetical protein